MSSWSLIFDSSLVLEGPNASDCPSINDSLHRTKCIVRRIHLPAHCGPLERRTVVTDERSRRVWLLWNQRHRNQIMTNSKPRRSTKPRLSAFATQLLEQWRRLELPTSETNIVIAVSGGADSTALFLALDELIKTDKLRLNLIVGHLDHGLRSESRKDALWVKELAKGLGCDVVVGSRKSESGSGCRRRRVRIWNRPPEKRVTSFCLRQP